MHVHILGICGTFMGGIAAIARAAGFKVTGSDRNVYPPMSTQLEALGVTGGTIAVIGGPEVFSLFLPLYDAFHLSRVANVTIPGGIPPFTEVGPNATPEDVLARRGFKPGLRRELDPAAGVSVVTWQR